MPGDLHMVGAFDVSRQPPPADDEIPDLEAIVDAVLYRAGGDARMAIRRLVLGRLHADDQVSAGYVRRRVAYSITR